MIPFPDFAPDRSDYALDAATLISNCIPVADGWGPLPDLVAIATALPSRCKGAISVQMTTGTYATFAGTSDKLWKLDTGTSPYSWVDVTRLVGGAYGVGTNDKWWFTVVGSLLTAWNINDNPQVIDISLGTNFADLAGSPPKAKVAWVVSEYLVAGNLDILRNAVQTSSYGDITGWTRGLGGSWRQEMPSGGEVQAGFGYETGAIVFLRNSIRRMTFTGDSAGFRFDDVSTARGAIAPYCVVPIGPGQFFYLSDNGFYVFNNGEDIPIGAERVDRWFLGTDAGSLPSQVDRNSLPDVRGFLDPFRKVVLIQYPKVDGSFGLLGVNYQLTGSDGRLGRWFSLDNNIEEVIAIATAGVTIDGLTALFGTIDGITVPFDSRLLSGGKPTIGAFNTNHELCLFTGLNKAPTLQTSRVQLFPGYRALVQEISVVGDLDPEDITIQVGTADRRGVAPTFSPAISCETDGSGLFKPLDDGRFHQFQVNIPQGVDWSSVAGIDDQESSWVKTGRT